MALVAHAMRRPFYVAVESYKFARMYPLSQRDIRDMSSKMPTCSSAGQIYDNAPQTASASSGHGGSDTAMMGNSIGGVRSIVTGTDIVPKDIPSIDFTPAHLITLLFTDLGVLTPAAVSDELIRLYQ